MAAPNFTPLFQPIFVAAEDNHGPNDIDACIRLLNEQLEAYHVGPYRPVVTETDMDPSINAVVDALNFSSATITAGLNKLIASFVELQQTTRLFPLRIANGCASPDTPLLYPDGHVGGPPGHLPITKEEALCITGEHANQCLVQLGVPVVLDNPQALVKQFLVYIGVKV